MNELNHTNDIIPLTPRASLSRVFNRIVSNYMTFIPGIIKTDYGNVNVDVPPADFKEWGPSNPCFSCGGGCCSNIRIPLSTIPYLPPGEIFGELENFIKNPDPEDAIDLKEFNETEPGVYYTYGNKGSYLNIIGDCPGLAEDGGCKFHDKKRPKGCTDTVLDTIICIGRRKEDKSDLQK